MFYLRIILPDPNFSHVNQKLWAGLERRHWGGRVERLHHRQDRVTTMLENALREDE